MAWEAKECFPGYLCEKSLTGISKKADRQKKPEEISHEKREL